MRSRTIGVAVVRTTIASGSASQPQISSWASTIESERTVFVARSNVCSTRVASMNAQRLRAGSSANPDSAVTSAVGAVSRPSIHSWLPLCPTSERSSIQRAAMTVPGVSITGVSPELVAYTVRRPSSSSATTCSPEGRDREWKAIAEPQHASRSVRHQIGAVTRLELAELADRDVRSIGGDIDDVGGLGDRGVAVAGHRAEVPRIGRHEGPSVRGDIMDPAVDSRRDLQETAPCRRARPDGACC